CQQRRPRRSALRLRDVVPQLKPFPCKRVGPSGLRAAHDAAAVAPELPHAEVVNVEEEDVGPLSRQQIPGSLRLAAHVTPERTLRVPLAQPDRLSAPDPLRPRLGTRDSLRTVVRARTAHDRCARPGCPGLLPARPPRPKGVPPTSAGPPGLQE